jgi:hypothetical protein
MILQYTCLQMPIAFLSDMGRFSSFTNIKLYAPKLENTPRRNDKQPDLETRDDVFSKNTCLQKSIGGGGGSP